MKIEHVNTIEQIEKKIRSTIEENLKYYREAKKSNGNDDQEINRETDDS
jgi:hypothetical protein